MISICLILLGLTIRVISRRKKGCELGICKPEKFVKDGIYGVVRHPMYLGSLIMFLGLEIFCLDNFLEIGLLFYMMLHFVVDRMDREEQILNYHFGNEFLEYRNKVKNALIPFFI